MKNNVIKLMLILVVLSACKNEKPKENINELNESKISKPNQIGKKAFDIFTTSWFYNCDDSGYFKLENIHKKFCDLIELKKYVENSNLSEEQKNFYTTISKKEWSESKIKSLKNVFYNIRDLYCKDEFKYIDFTYEKNVRQGMTYIDGELHIEHSGKIAYSRPYILQITSILLNNEYKTTLIRFKE